VIGSDHAETSLAEVMHLRTLHLFDDRTLLKMWCEATPAAIFTDRRIGKFAEGYEASFLALAGNPLEDFDQVRAIRLRVKQGCPARRRPDEGRCLVGSESTSSLERGAPNRHRVIIHGHTWSGQIGSEGMKCSDRVGIVGIGLLAVVLGRHAAARRVCG
jgi:hypothetical protein